jgi:hypothetical protein
MFIFLIAGHEVRYSPFPYDIVPKQFSTDDSAYAMLYVCLVGTVSQRARAFVSTHQRRYV